VVYFGTRERSARSVSPDRLLRISRGSAPDEDSLASRLCTCASSQLGPRKAEHGDPPTTWQQRQQAVNIVSKTALFAVSSTSGPVNGVHEVFRRTACCEFHVDLPLGRGFTRKSSLHMRI
ncbi:hypothetical protein MTO96_039350, partial [Rhipicephalus appendiculatus]